MIALKGSHKQIYKPFPYCHVKLIVPRELRDHSDGAGERYGGISGNNGSAG